MARAVALATVLACVGVARCAHADPRSRSYATPLTLSYAIPIGIDAAAWALVATSDTENPAPYAEVAAEVGYYGVPVTWLAPGVVHAASGEPLRGVGSVGGSAAGFAAGLVLGFPIFLVAASATSSDAHPWGTAPAWALWPTLGLVGESVWAVHDVNDNATHESDDAAAAVPGLRLVGVGVRPLRGGGGAASAAFAF